MNKLETKNESKGKKIHCPYTDKVQYIIVKNRLLITELYQARL